MKAMFREMAIWAIYCVVPAWSILQVMAKTNSVIRKNKGLICQSHWTISRCRCPPTCQTKFVPLDILYE